MSDGSSRRSNVGGLHADKSFVSAFDYVSYFCLLPTFNPQSGFAKPWRASPSRSDVGRLQPSKQRRRRTVRIGRHKAYQLRTLLHRSCIYPSKPAFCVWRIIVPLQLGVVYHVLRSLTHKGLSRMCCLRSLRVRSRISFKQEYKCPICGQSIFNDEPLHLYHKILRSEGGKDEPKNLVWVHLFCHHKVHYQCKTQIE